MLKIIDKKGSGKTKKLLEEASKFENSLVLCENPNDLSQKALNYGFKGISFCDYNSCHEYDSNMVLFIDDLDKYLQLSNVHGFTLSED